MANRSDGMAIYMRIKEDLKKEYESLPNGARLPTEQALVDKYHCNRGTVRQAVAELVSEGFLHKIQGSGTYKGAMKAHNDYFFTPTFTEMIRSSGQCPGIADISLELVQSSADVARAMNIEEGRVVYKFARTRLVDDIPMARCTAYIRCEAMPSLKADDLEMSMTEMFVQKGFDITDKQIVCKATSIPKDVGKLLKVAPKSPVLYMVLKGNAGGFAPLFVDYSYFCENYALKLDPERT